MKERKKLDGDERRVWERDRERKIKYFFISRIIEAGMETIRRKVGHDEIIIRYYILSVDLLNLQPLFAHDSIIGDEGLFSWKAIIRPRFAEQRWRRWATTVPCFSHWQGLTGADRMCEKGLWSCSCVKQALLISSAATAPTFYVFKAHFTPVLKGGNIKSDLERECVWCNYIPLFLACFVRVMSRGCGADGAWRPIWNFDFIVGFRFPSISSFFPDFIVSFQYLWFSDVSSFNFCEDRRRVKVYGKERKNLIDFIEFIFGGKGLFFF